MQIRRDNKLIASKGKNKNKNRQSARLGCFCYLTCRNRKSQIHSTQSGAHCEKWLCECPQNQAQAINYIESAEGWHYIMGFRNIYSRFLVISSSFEFYAFDWVAKSCWHLFQTTSKLERGKNELKVCFSEVLFCCSKRFVSAIPSNRWWMW